MVETRNALRHRVLKAGTIAFGGGGIDCTIRNLSATGAALEVAAAVGIPDNFVLVVAREGLNLPCHAVWRKQYRIGVAFDRTAS
jgi:hypothetical protein